MHHPSTHQPCRTWSPRHQGKCRQAVWPRQRPSCPSYRTWALRATGDIVAEQGFEGLDLADVAKAAEVGRTTVYRRWSTPTGLIGDLLVAMADESLPRTDHGSIADDLRANALLVQSTLADARQARLFRGLIAAATCDPGTAEALHKYYAARIAEWAPCVDAAVHRAELPENTDSSQVIRAVSAPLYYAFVASGQPLTPQLAHQAADALAAARAGVFATKTH